MEDENEEMEEINRKIQEKEKLTERELETLFWRSGWDDIHSIIKEIDYYVLHPEEIDKNGDIELCQFFLNIYFFAKGQINDYPIS